MRTLLGSTMLGPQTVMIYNGDFTLRYEINVQLIY